ncbi:MAG: hypothetical protein AAFO75_00185 [Pseudomonadota bacterium]
MSHSPSKARRSSLAAVFALGLAVPFGLALGLTSATVPVEAASLKKLDQLTSKVDVPSFKKGSKSKKVSKSTSGKKLKSAGLKKSTAGKKKTSLLKGKSAGSIKSKLSKYIDLGDDTGGSGVRGLTSGDGYSSGSIRSKASKWKSRARDFVGSLDF